MVYISTEGALAGMWVAVFFIMLILFIAAGGGKRKSPKNERKDGKEITEEDIFMMFMLERHKDDRK